MNKLYEDNALGNIESKRYEQLSGKYAEEYYSLKAEQEQIEERLSEFENANQRAKNFIRLAKVIQTLKNLLLLLSMSLSIKSLCMSEMLKEQNMPLSVSKSISTISENLKMN